MWGKIVIALILVAVFGGTAAFFLTTGEQPVIKLVASENVIRVEAAGVRYADWPIMGVVVNDQEIAQVEIAEQQRKMYSVNVPESVGDISTIKLKLNNFQECQNVGTGPCETRKIIVRGLYLNDEKLEGGVASGEKNLASLLQTEEGGITWQVGQ